MDRSEFGATVAGGEARASEERERAGVFVCVYATPRCKLGRVGHGTAI